MRGQLQYKDAHGRVWRLWETDMSYNRWTAETLDKGHTEEYLHVATVLDDLILIIDTEEYLIESRKLTSQQAGQGVESVRLPEPQGPESIAEIREAASEAEGNDSEEQGTLGGSEERNE